MTYDNTAPDEGDTPAPNSKERRTSDMAAKQRRDMAPPIPPEEFDAQKLLTFKSTSVADATASSSSSISSSGPSGSSSFDQEIKGDESCITEGEGLNDREAPQGGCDSSKSEPRISRDYPASACSDGKLQPPDLGSPHPICYDPVLDDEIRNRLDQLNALSDLINSLELQFDHANVLFRETLKCSTERLTAISKTLGSKNIRKGRIYLAAKKAVERTQADCQEACVQFEQANNDCQFAKQAINEAESRLREINSETRIGAAAVTDSFDFVDLCELNLNDNSQPRSLDIPEGNCDNSTARSLETTHPKSETESRKIQGSCDEERILTTVSQSDTTNSDLKRNDDIDVLIDEDGDDDLAGTRYLSTHYRLNSAKLSEDLNQAIIKLIDAEQRRRQCEKTHLDRANQLILAQENLTKFERENGASIRRTQVYFDQAELFNAKLSSVKDDISRISKEITAAKQAYAQTLNQLEQFSEDLHINSNKTPNHPTKDT